MYLQNVIIRTTGQLITFGIGVIFSALSVRIFGIEAIGRIGYMVAYVSIFAIFLNPGFSSYYIRNVAQNKNVSTDISNYSFLKIMLFVIFVSLAVYVYSLKDYSQIDNYLYLIAVIFIILNEINGIFTSTLVGKEKFFLLSCGGVLSGFVKLILLFLLYFIWQNILGLAMLMIADQLIRSIYYSFIAKRENFKFIKPEKKILKQYVTFTLPLFFFTVQGNFFPHFEKLVVAYFIDKKAVGFLLCAQAILGGINIIIKSISNTAFPKLSKDVSCDKVTFNEKFARLINFNTVVGGMLSIQLFVLADPLVRLMYGEGNLYIATLLKIYAFYILFRLFNRSYYSLLLILEKHRFYSYFQTFFIPIMTILLYILLIPKNFYGINWLGLGVVGIPLSMTIKIIISVIVACTILRKSIPVHIFFQGLLTIATAIFVLLFSFFVNISGGYWTNLLFTFILTNGIFICIAYLRGIFRSQDYQYVLSSIVPENIYGSLKREFQTPKTHG